MRKYIKILKWLIKNQDKLQNLIDNKPEHKNEVRYSLAGVPKNQLQSIDDILKDETVK